MNADGATPPDPAHRDQDEQLLALLRAADPARAASTDTAALRAAVDERIAMNQAGTPRQRTEGTDDVGGSAAGVPVLDRETGSGAPAAGAEKSADDAEGEEWPAVEGGDVAVPARPRRRQWMMAAAVAAMLAVGAGGYAIGAQRSVPPVVVADQDSRDDQPEAETMAGEDSADTLQEPQTLDGDEAGSLDSVQPWWDVPGPLPITFTDGGLATDTGQDEAWVMDPASATAGERVSQLATDLGVEGEPSDRHGTWVVADEDAGRSLQVQSDATATLDYLDTSVRLPCEAEDEADEAGGHSPDQDSANEAPEDEGQMVPEDCAPDLAAFEPPEDAVETALEFLDSAGVDTSQMGAVAQPLEPEQRGYSVTVSPHTSDGGTEPAIWTLMVTVDGVHSARGPLAEPVSLGDYPTISAAEAATRLADPKFGASGRNSSPGSDPTGPAPAVPEAGSAIPWPVDQIELTDAEMILDGYYAEDGQQLFLLPTWELSNDAGEIWRVLAVEESALNLP